MQIQSAIPRRFDRVAISSVLGSPDSPSVWSAAPYNLANALERLGISVVRVDSGLSRTELGLLALRYFAAGHGIPPSTEAVRRSPAARSLAARRLVEGLGGSKVDSVIHTGTLDMEAPSISGSLRHYLYCDDDWTFSFPNRPDAHRYSNASVETFAVSYPVVGHFKFLTGRDGKPPGRSCVVVKIRDEEGRVGRTRWE